MRDPAPRPGCDPSDWTSESLPSVSHARAWKPGLRPRCCSPSDSRNDRNVEWGDPPRATFGSSRVPVVHVPVPVLAAERRRIATPLDSDGRPIVVYFDGSDVDGHRTRDLVLEIALKLALTFAWGEIPRDRRIRFQPNLIGTFRLTPPVGTRTLADVVTTNRPLMVALAVLASAAAAVGVALAQNGTDPDEVVTVDRCPSQQEANAYFEKTGQELKPTVSCAGLPEPDPEPLAPEPEGQEPPKDHLTVAEAQEKFDPQDDPWTLVGKGLDGEIVVLQTTGPEPPEWVKTPADAARWVEQGATAEPGG